MKRMGVKGAFRTSPVRLAGIREPLLNERVGIEGSRQSFPNEILGDGGLRADSALFFFYEHR